MFLYIYICTVKRGYSWHNSLESESRCSTHLLLVCAVMMRVVPNVYIVCWSHTMSHRREPPETTTPECIYLPLNQAVLLPSVTSHCCHILSRSHIQLHPRGRQDDRSWRFFPGLLFKAHQMSTGSQGVWRGRRNVMCAVLMGPEESVLCPGIWVTDGCEVVVETEPRSSEVQQASPRNHWAIFPTS